ncbi:MAG: 4-alpha-glucanotransferase [Endomicrobiales bacterium]
MDKRRSGVLLHITSLPSPYGVGDLGPAAYAFADFLANTGQSLWQVLPLTQTHKSHGNSPYSSVSAFAGNTLLISPELMAKDGFISPREAAPFDDLPRDRVDYDGVIARKLEVFNAAYRRFKDRGKDGEYGEFCGANGWWLDDFALFMSIRSHFKGKLWRLWPKGMRDREPAPLKAVRSKFHEYIEREKFLQYVFHRQWRALREYCGTKGVRVIGDIPIYVNYDSADVWTSPGLFKLDGRKRPRFVAGVPPDYFSATGQRWGNPVYDWEKLAQTGYAWWIKRLEQNFELFDVVRIDHFRGFAGYWEIEAREKTAVNGKWAEGPGEAFFNALLKHFKCLPIIAEDLGTITPDVRELMDQFCFPGMKVLLFAFGDDLPDNPYLPSNYEENCVVYTGTHDNNTVRGWFEHEATEENRKRLFRYLGRELSADDVSAAFLEMALMSNAHTALTPLQDVLGLGAEARMNKPATLDGNWQWRFSWDQVDEHSAVRLLELTKASRRLAPKQEAAPAGTP